MTSTLHWRADRFDRKGRKVIIFLGDGSGDKNAYRDALQTQLDLVTKDLHHSEKPTGLKVGHFPSDSKDVDAW